MEWIVAGIDEAGYGPTLGPLCVAMSVFRVRAETIPKPPDLWTLLEPAVCREPGRGGKPDAKGRIAVADSKQLKLSNSVKSTHPLVHLERGVLAFLSTLGDRPATTNELFSRLGAVLDAHPCYATSDQSPDTVLPCATPSGELGIAANLLNRTMVRANVDLLDLSCIAIGESRFNHIIRETGNKTSTTGFAIQAHMRKVWEKWGTLSDSANPDSHRVTIVCDRQGGRADYAPFLQHALRADAASVETLEQTDTRSSYRLTAETPGGIKRLGISFMVEGEQHHLPIALASMTAKYVRELSMNRFNAYWAQQHSQSNQTELKPTAGYALDARRWLTDIASTMSKSDREALTRIA